MCISWVCENTEQVQCPWSGQVDSWSHQIEVLVDFCGMCQQEGIAVASIARDDPSTLPGDDPFPHARMHRDCNAR